MAKSKSIQTLTNELAEVQTRREKAAEEARVAAAKLSDLDDAAAEAKRALRRAVDESVEKAMASAGGDGKAT